MKYYNPIKNENAFALISTLLFGTLSLGLLVMAFNMVTTTASISGETKRYSVELDTAKGAAGYVMAELRNANVVCGASPGVTCTPSTAVSPTCSPNAQVLLNPQICTALGKTNCIGLTACFLSENLYTPPVTMPPDPDITFYSVQVTSTNTIGETATIDFVYKVQ